MKFNKLFNSLLALSILAPAMAMAATNCEPANGKLTTVQRTAYVKQCLAEASAPANVQRLAQQQKAVSCEQNSRNLSLQGPAKSSYIAKCVNQDQAREAAVRIRSYDMVSSR